METKLKGRIITASVASVRHLQCDEVWQITRSNKLIPGAKWVPQLSPSWNLFSRYLREWNGRPPQEWWEEYKVQFAEELQSEEKRNALRILYSEVKKGKVIVLACFCPNGAFCHRSLVASFLEDYGVISKEYTDADKPIDNSFQQLDLFEII